MAISEDELMSLQLSLEREMRDLGEKRFMDKLLEATQQKRESTTPASISLLKGAIIPVADAIDLEVKRMHDEKGRIHKRLFRKIGDTDSKIVAYLTMKAILDCVSRGEALTAMGIKIGRYIEDELRLKSYMQQNRPLMDKVKRNVQKRTSNYKHQRNVMVHSANKAGLRHAQWTTDYQLSLGLRLIDIVITATNLFEIVTMKRPRGRHAKHIVPTKKTLGWLLGKNDYMSILRPLKLPTVVSPKPWVSLQEGGYFSLKTPFVKATIESEFKDYLGMSDNPEVKFNQVFDIVNAIQEVPWNINQKVLEVVEHFWEKVDEDVLTCLPKKNEIIGPAYPGDDADYETKKNWKIISTKVYSENIRNMSHKIAFHKMLWVANKFKDRPLYFPHNVDFRGRVYPLPDFLTPQGDDISRGLLEFAKGQEIKTEHGEKNFLLYGASLYGHDKLSDENKLNWVSENSDAIIWSAMDSMGVGTLWHDSDKPWQFLAWCFEFDKLVKNRNTKLHLPIMVDGTCNGLQHLSAIMKDKVGGTAVNLVDTGDTPNDIYQMVSDEANKIYKGTTMIDRKLCKRPVMTTPYGSTIYGIREQIKDELKKRQDKIGVDMEWQNWEDIEAISDAIYEGISKVIVKSREFMDWLQEIAETITSTNRPLEWVTPFGFYVLQTYHKTKQRRLNTQLNGKLKSYKASLREAMPYYQDVQKNKNAISPNFIHSLDAAHLMFTVNDLRYEHGIRNIYVVHDCFGVHADHVDLLVNKLKQTFIEMYSGDCVVNSFIEDYLKEYLDKVDYFKVVEQRPTTGSLDINDVNKSRFFFS